MGAVIRPALGKHHPLLRLARALRRSAAAREGEGLYLAEGPHLLEEALAAGAGIEAVLHTPDLAASDEGAALLARCTRLGVRTEEIPDAALAAVTEARSPQPVVSLVRGGRRTEQELERLLERVPLALLLDGVQDPGNLGSIVRTADAAGCEVVLVAEASADPLHPRAVRATMGSIFRVAALREPAAAALSRLARAGFRLVGADPHGGTDYDRADLSGKLALCLGGEGAGLSEAVRERLHDLVRIPLRPGVESLAVPAAAAVLLFEIARQRRR